MLKQSKKKNKKGREMRNCWYCAFIVARYIGE